MSNMNKLSSMTSHLVMTYRPVSELIPDSRNARTHPKRQIDQLRASIDAFGFTNPILADPDHRWPWSITGGADYGAC